MTGTAMEIISWLSQQKDGQRYEISLCREKRSLNQNSLYWEIVGIIARSLKKPDAYVHNLLLRRCEIYEKLDGKVVCISLPDTDEAELWVEYNEEYHYKPTLDRFKNSNGTQWRWYKVLKGSKEFDTSEMSRLIDIALDELNNMGLQLPQTERFMKALEEHGRIKKENE